MDIDVRAFDPRHPMGEPATPPLARPGGRPALLRLSVNALAEKQWLT